MAAGEHVCILSMFNGNAVAIQLPARVTLEITETEPAMKGQNGVVVLQAGQAQQRRPRDGAAAHPAGHARRDPDRRRRLCGAREGLRRGERAAVVMIAASPLLDRFFRLGLSAAF